MEISVQTGGIIEIYGAEKTGKWISEAGFTAIDWNINRGWQRQTLQEIGYLPDGCIYDKSLEEIEDFWKEQSDAWKKYGLKIGQVHAPFPAYVFDNPDFFEYALSVYKRFIEYCDHMGVTEIVLHGISLPPDEKRLSQAEVDQLNRRLYSSLIPSLLKTDITLCLENLPTGKIGNWHLGHCSDPYQAAREIDALNEMAGKECFGLCLDTGHLHLVPVDVKEYISILGKRIKALHIHDNDGFDDQHMGPYTGSFPWADFVEALREIGYEGNLNFETFAQVKCLPEALVPAFLRQICTVGEFFRSEIQS